ncbi:hypothetical protein CPC08DRAFT_409800 [Agrocybe pediades]|nr:hypothetical protein CPC08DRAFT_409800 [Agrocybe pediades]
MPSRTTETADRGPQVGVRWRVNSNGQVIDAEAESASWELADEIGRLQIGDVTADTGDARVAIRTPPKSKLPPNAVITDSSPLDSSSNTSIGSSPPIPEQPISHSRGSSSDVVPNTEAKERPHSFSGGLSAADLRRLQQAGDVDRDRQVQQQQWLQPQFRDQNNEQLAYPSLTNHVNRPGPTFNYPPNGQVSHTTERDREDLPIEYNAAAPLQQQARSFASMPPHLNHGLMMNSMNTQAPAPPLQYNQARPNNGAPTMNYRQPPRNFAPQGPAAPPTLGYTGGHTSHLSLGNTQQLYEMMLPGPPPVHDNHHPAVARVQQQHNVFRGTHHHSASDPSALRDVAALQLLNNNMQNFNPNLFQSGIPPQPMQLYPNQYYGGAADMAVQQVMAARLQAQYTGSYGVGTPPTIPHEEVGSPTSSSGQTGPSANNRKLGLYKTELCRSWEEKGTCRYGGKCQFAHGEEELRKVTRHPKYKTEICKTFWVSGSCPYGKRCCFIHTEVSANPPTTASSTENTPPQPTPDGRQRSDSDPEISSSVSLLSRIQRTTDSATNTPSTPVEINTTSNFQFSRPPTGSLRVDTSALDGASIKQNKSAYPSFASNGILLPASDHVTVKSPAPVTAGPVVGRHHFARMEIVGYPNHQKKNSTSSATNSNPRHSFDGSDADLNFSSSPPTSGHNYGQENSSQQQQGGPTAAPTRVNGHVRSGSAGNWGSISRSNLSTSTSAYQHGTASAAGEIMSNSPWSSTELAMGTSRLHEKTWV